jgi:hypothetical protein
VQSLNSLPALYGTRKFIAACVHKSFPLVPILSQTSPVQSIPPHPISARSILMLSTYLRLGFRSGIFPSGFNTRNLYAVHFSLHSRYVPCTPQPPWVDNSVTLGEEYKSRDSSLCRFLDPLFTPSIFGRNILRSTLFSDTLSLCSSFKSKTRFHIHTKPQAKLWSCIF